MSTNGDTTANTDWGEESLAHARREIADSLTCGLIPNRYRYGIMRMLEFMVSYPNGSVVDEVGDLAVLMIEVMNSVPHVGTPVESSNYSLDEVKWAMALASEFNIVSVARGDGGAVQCVDLRKNAVSFALTVANNYELGLKLAKIMDSRHSNSPGSAATVQFDHWAEVARPMLLSLLHTNAVSVEYSYALEQLSDNALSVELEALGGGEAAIDKLFRLGAISIDNEVVAVVPDVAALFLTDADDGSVLEKLFTY